MSSSSFSFFGKKQVYMIKWFALRILTSHCFIQSKYLILAPLAVHSIYSFLFKEESERDLTNFLNSHFCYGGCFTSKYGLVFLVTEMQKATYLLTRVFNLTKSTESKIGQYIYAYIRIGVSNLFAQKLRWYKKNFWRDISFCLYQLRDDQIIFNGIMYYLLNSTLPGASHFLFGEQME